MAPEHTSAASSSEAAVSQWLGIISRTNVADVRPLTGATFKFVVCFDSVQLSFSPRFQRPKCAGHFDIRSFYLFILIFKYYDRGICLIKIIKLKKSWC